MSIFSFIVVGIYIVEVTGFFYFAINADKSPIPVLVIHYLPMYAFFVIILTSPYVQSNNYLFIAFIDIIFTLLYVYGFVLYMRLKNNH